VKIGDLVKYRARTPHDYHGGWLGIIVREIPGTDEIKVVEWTPGGPCRNRGGYKARDLELVNENR